MREILFKGKRVDNGEWVQGSPRDYIVGAISAIEFYDGLTDCETVEVTPETVGQYTGLTDKNGNMIFEGDILRRTLCDDTTDYIVKWFDKAAMFILTYSSNAKCHTDFTICESTDCEIIGNIHDNPELLEENN